MGAGWVQGGRQSGAAPPTWAPEASPGETRGEVLCCTKSGRLALPGNRLALPGKPLLAAELRLRSPCFWKERERGGLLCSEAVIDRSGDGGRGCLPLCEEQGGTKTQRLSTGERAPHHTDRLPAGQH